MIVRIIACAAIVAAALSAPAAAQQAPPPAKPAQSQGYDSNERICETITVTGSRLGKKRICGTRAEFAERRLRDRQEVERAQTSPCMPQRTASGSPSC